MRKVILLLVLGMSITITNAQTKEELKAQKAEKQKIADAAQAEVNALQAKIDALPGWRTGIFGTIGGSISEFTNSFTQATPNNSTGSIGFTVNAYANLIQEKYFWRNAVNINLGWVKSNDRDDPTDDSSFRESTDVFNISSLYGRKFGEKFAISSLAEYRTTLLSNFNDPGYLDVGVGGTWTPLKNLIIVIQPLNFNFVFSSGDTVFDSSLGAKIVTDYTRKIGAINFKTNLSIFQSYDTNDLSNWTWNNSFAYTFWKKIGVGFDFGLRSNKQEALNFALSQIDPSNPPVITPDFDNIDNDLQTYWTLGLSYSF